MTSPPWADAYTLDRFDGVALRSAEDAATGTANAAMTTRTRMVRVDRRASATAGWCIDASLVVLWGRGRTTPVTSPRGRDCGWTATDGTVTQTLPASWTRNAKQRRYRQELSGDVVRLPAFPAGDAGRPTEPKVPSGMLGQTHSTER